MKYLAILVLFLISCSSAEDRLIKVYPKEDFTKMQKEQPAVYECMLHATTLKASDLELKILCQQCIVQNVRVKIPT